MEIPIATIQLSRSKCRNEAATVRARRISKHPRIPAYNLVELTSCVICVLPLLDRRGGCGEAADGVVVQLQNEYSRCCTKYLFF
jgi:hypothetical protein